MSCRFQPDYRGDAMFRGDAMGRTEPCLDFTFDILVGGYVPSPVIPGLIPRDLFKDLACDQTIVDMELSTFSHHALYRTSDFVANHAYFARFFDIQATDAGMYSIILSSVNDFKPYVTIHRSNTIQWQGEPDESGVFEFDVSTLQTGPMTVEVSTVDRYETGSFDISLTCPSTSETGTCTIAPLFIHVGNVGYPYYQVPDTFGWTVGSEDLSQSGETEPIEWMATGLPSGLSIDSATGVISGSPSISGTFPVTVKVRKSGTQRCHIDYTLVIHNPLTIQELVDVNSWFVSCSGEGTGLTNGALLAFGFESDGPNWRGFFFPTVGTPATIRLIPDTPRSLYLNAGAGPFQAFYQRAIGDSGFDGAYNWVSGGDAMCPPPAVITLS